MPSQNVQLFCRDFKITDDSSPEALLAELNGEVIKVEGKIKALLHEKESLQRKLNEKQNELYEVEDGLKIIGVVDPDELKKIQDREREIRELKVKLESKLEAAWEYSFPVYILGQYRETLLRSLLAEDIRREWENAKSTVEPKIPQVKKEVFDEPPNEYKLEPKVKDFYETRLSEALSRLFHPPPEGMAEKIYLVGSNTQSAKVRSCLNVNEGEIVELEETCSNIQRLDVELSGLNAKIREMQQNAAAFSRGRELHEKRGSLKTECEQIQNRLDDIEAEIRISEITLADLKTRETKQREKVEQVRSGENLSNLAMKYREAAGEIRTRAAEQMRKQIAENVGNIWIDIVGRSQEFERMEFDKHWQCFLYRRDGSKVAWDEINTSAGQRQVRMLAFYEALRLLARLVPPLVVDTPLARLDKEVRSNVLEKLYLSGHQSIILSTNAEIDPEGKLFEQIRDRIARVYTLHPHGKANSIDYEVAVTPDYFGREL